MSIQARPAEHWISLFAQETPSASAATSAKFGLADTPTAQRRSTPDDNGDFASMSDLIGNVPPHKQWGGAEMPLVGVEWRLAVAKGTAFGADQVLYYFTEPDGFSDTSKYTTTLVGNAATSWTIATNGESAGTIRMCGIVMWPTCGTAGYFHWVPGEAVTLVQLAIRRLRLPRGRMDG